MKNEEIFKVSEEGITFENLVKNAPNEILEEIQSSDIIILPSHGHENCFYQGSIDILDYLNNNNLETGIYTTDEDYQELALHGADIWLGTFFIKYIAIPVFNIVIGNYIFNKLKAKPTDTISLEFIVENEDGNTKNIKYKGPVEDLTKVIDSVKGSNNNE